VYAVVVEVRFIVEAAGTVGVTAQVPDCVAPNAVLPILPPAWNGVPSAVTAACADLLICFHTDMALIGVVSVAAFAASAFVPSVAFHPST
jgi:hypothetical protein